jgi:16S rRNA (adenine1518-N6/adenine1519-N6)-dimethyltransferase
MAQTKHQIQSLLSEANAQPRHRFGQNFMIDGNLVRIVAEAGQIKPNDIVIEVGPGTGTLTEELLATGAKVLAVEIDNTLAELLRTRFASRDNFSLIQGDALASKRALNPDLLQSIRNAKAGGQTVRLIANLPYNIASPLIIELLIAGVDLLAFTVQKEVADRLRADPGSKDYGTLSIMTQLLSRVEVLRTLPPQAFWPMPKIESALVRLVRHDQLSTRAPDFNTFLQRIFSARRKMLRKALDIEGIDAEKLLAQQKINPQSRPEEIPPADFLRLFNSIQKNQPQINADARR